MIDAAHHQRHEDDTLSSAVYESDDEATDENRIMMTPVAVVKLMSNAEIIIMQCSLQAGVFVCPCASVSIMSWMDVDMGAGGGASWRRLTICFMTTADI